ncbi:MAG: aminotransferase class I/II-fold pyridoxal phosphate-dependent enzyme, partial [Bacteroidia bacterium]
QYAALGAMEGGFAYVKTQLTLLEKLRKKLLVGLQPLANICRISAAEGALYVWLELPAGTDELAIAKALIYQYKVAVIPGGTFGATRPSLRLSFGALDDEMVETGIKRLCVGIPALLNA